MIKGKKEAPGCMEKGLFLLGYWFRCLVFIREEYDEEVSSVGDEGGWVGVVCCYLHRKKPILSGGDCGSFPMKLI